MHQLHYLKSQGGGRQGRLTCAYASPGRGDLDVARPGEDGQAIRRLQLGHDEAHTMQVLQAQALHLPQAKEDPLHRQMYSLGKLAYG